MKICVGPANIANYANNISKGLRELGHEVTTVELDPHPFYESHPDTIKLRPMLSDAKTWIAGGELRYKHGPVLEKFLLAHDVFVIIAAQSFAPGLIDLPWLRQHGKKIISWLPGSECRHWEAAKPMWEDYGSPLPDILEASARPLTTPATHYSVAVTGPYTSSLLVKLHNIRMCELYSDSIFSLPEILGLGIRPFRHIPAPIDLDLFEFNTPNRDIPVIVHAPSNKGFKQTDLVLRTLEELTDEGLEFELDLLEKVPHSKVRESLSNADILIDQMSLYPAVLAHEGLASGCVVLTGNSEAAYAFPNDKPFVNITPGNLKEQVRSIVKDKNRRLNLALRGLQYVHKYCGLKNIAESIINISAAPDYFPNFFLEDFVPNGKEPLPDYLKILNGVMLERAGSYSEVNVAKLEKLGLLMPGQIDKNKILRWDRSNLKQLSKWSIILPS